MKPSESILTECIMATYWVTLILHPSLSRGPLVRTDEPVAEVESEKKKLCRKDFL